MELNEVAQPLFDDLVRAQAAGERATEWRLDPTLGMQLLNARDQNGGWLVTGASGECRLFGLPVITDPEIDGFRLVTTRA